jgi:hypothetical protein
VREKTVSAVRRANDRIVPVREYGETVEFTVTRIVFVGIEPGVETSNDDNYDYDYVTMTMMMMMMVLVVMVGCKEQRR